MSIKPKLLCRPQPFDDESISSYLIRLAESNGHALASLLRLFEFRKEAHNRSYIYTAADYSIISAFTGCSEQKLRTLAYEPVKTNNRALIGTYNVFGNHIESALLKYKNHGICPDCLREKPYLRKIWEMFTITACPIHNKLLVNVCPKCNGKITYLRNKICFCKTCDFDFRDIESQTLDENGLILIKRIYHLCGFYEESKNNFPEILKNLKLMPLCSLLFTVTPLNLNNAVRASILGTYIATLPIPTRHQVLLDSLSLFEDFPNNFFVFLTSLKNIYSYRVSEKIKHVSTARIIIYNTITRCIRKTLTDPEFDFVRDAYQEYLLRERLDSYGLVIDYSQHHSAKIFLERHMRLDEARSKLGVTAVAVLEMMKIGTIRFCETKSKIERYYLNREDVEATAKRLKTCISIPQASQILGVEAFHLNRLINDGYLHLIEDLRITPVYSRVLDKREVNNLFDTFRNAMLNSPFYKKKNLNTLNFRQTALWLGILKINFSGMYKLIKSGDLTPVDYNPSEKGVMGFVYLKSEVDKIYKDYMKAEFSNTYGSKELVKILKINTTIFSKVVKKNYLKFFESGTFLRIRFTKKSFENFQKKYIFTNELSAKFSTSNEYVNKKLAEMKVYPVDNSLSKHIHLYLRKNVKNLIIQKSQMVLEQSRKNRLAQKLTIQQAAHELNLSEEEILMAVDHKLLPPIKKTEHGILFSPLRIATFKSWNLPHMNFLRTRAAAKFMNCSLNKFKSNYEFTGKITPEIRKYKNKSVYKFYDLNVLKTLQD